MADARKCEEDVVHVPLAVWLDAEGDDEAVLDPHRDGGETLHPQLFFDDRVHPPRLQVREDDAGPQEGLNGRITRRDLESDGRVGALSKLRLEVVKAFVPHIEARADETEVLGKIAKDALDDEADCLRQALLVLNVVEVGFHLPEELPVVHPIAFPGTTAPDKKAPGKT